MPSFSIKAKAAVLAGCLALVAGPASAKQLTFGLSVPIMSVGYLVTMVKGFTDAAKAKGVKVIVLNAQGSEEKQANDIDDLLSQGVDGIAINALNPTGSVALVNKVAARGIPIVAGATQIGNPAHRSLEDVYPKLTALIAAREVRAGEISGLTAAKLLPKGRVGRIAVVEGAPGYTVVGQRLKGFKEGLRKSGAKYKIVAIQPTNWSSAQGESVCQNLLVAHPNLDVIFSEADNMALGCMHAIANAHSKAVIVSANGGDKLGNRAIREGKIAASICDRPGLIGKLMFKYLYAAVEGKDTKKAQFITYPLLSINKNNVSKCPGTY